jgi:hypothetical protein
MPRVPKRYNHFVFGVVQSGLTCLVAAAIANRPFLTGGSFVSHWLESWLLAWMTMLPIVIFAAPLIRRLVAFLTFDEAASNVCATSPTARERSAPQVVDLDR